MSHQILNVLFQSLSKPEAVGQKMRIEGLVGTYMLLDIKVCDLIACKLRSKQGPRMFPVLAIRREDAISQHREEDSAPLFANHKVVELCRKNSLNVLWLGCDEIVSAK